MVFSPFVLPFNLPEMPAWCLQLWQKPWEHENEGHSLGMLEQKVKKSTVCDDKWSHSSVRHPWFACLQTSSTLDRKNPQTPHLFVSAFCFVFSSTRWFLPDGWLLQLMCWWSVGILESECWAGHLAQSLSVSPESFLNSLYLSFFNCKMGLIIAILIEFVGQANKIIHVNCSTLTYLQ